jgi:hypothetical protein
VREVVAMVERVGGRRVHTRNAPRRAGDPPRLVADARQARALLGWQPCFAELDRIIATIRSTVLATPSMGRDDLNASLANVTDYGTVDTPAGVTHSSAILDVTVVTRGA